MDPIYNYFYNPQSVTLGFGDPFADYSSRLMPRTIADALRFSEFIFYSNGVYASAVDRIVSYFITDIEIIGDISDEERERYTDYLKNEKAILNYVKRAGIELFCYGNVFVSVMLLPHRLVQCPQCKLKVEIEFIFENKEFKTKWEIPRLFAKCPKCGYEGVWHDESRRFIDRIVNPDQNIVIKFWNPHYIRVQQDEYSERCHIYYRIPSTHRNRVRRGDPLALKYIDWNLLLAIAKDDDFRFDDNAILHLKEEPLSGIMSGGWGLSRSLMSWRDIWYFHLLRRYNEAITADYLVPFRVITPPATANPMTDPAQVFDLSNFTNYIKEMVALHRNDPGSMHILPFPIQYQILGGEAKALAPRDFMEFALDVMLNVIGTPVEFYRGNLSTQAATVALRLFESIFRPFVHQMNRFLNWVAGQIAGFLNWEDIEVRLKPVSLIDDINKQMVKLQLMSARAISQTTGLASLGIDFREEVRRIMQEEKYQAEQAQKLQQELQELQAQLGAIPPVPSPGAGQGGSPQGASPEGSEGPVLPTAQLNEAMLGAQNVPQSPAEMTAFAEQLADQLLSMPEPDRVSYMIKLKRSNPALHALVKQKIEDKRYRAEKIGGRMLLQQRG